MSTEKPEDPAAGQKPYREVQCLRCGFVYDEAAGLEADGIAPGTRWEDVPEDWGCPDCFASKSDFS